MESWIEKISNAVNNNFEFLVWLNFAWLFFFAVLWLSLKVKETVLTKPYLFLTRFLFFCVVAGELCLLLAAGYIYWFNYQRETVVNFEERLLPTTNWVKEKLTVYFIAGNELLSVDLQGRNRKRIFEAQGRIREYHFSPDGNYLLIVTDRELHNLNLEDNTRQLIEAVDLPPSEKQFSSIIRAVSWSPTSQQFCYTVSHWSSFAAQDFYYIYDIAENKRKQIETNREISFLYWNRAGDGLYYFQVVAKDTNIKMYPYLIKVYKIHLQPGIPVQFITEIASRTTVPPQANLALRSIEIFWEAKDLSFGAETDHNLEWESDQGARLGIDESDHLYLVKGRWWRKRLFKVPREPLPGDFPRYQYQGGKLALGPLRWLPGGRYVLMGHRGLGVLILDPFTGKLGRLVQGQGHSFGWYRSSIEE